jgi:hypothetical protein
LVDSRARDGYALLAALEGRRVPNPVGQAAQLLATVLGQDLEGGEDGLLRIARKVAPDRVISTVDTEARHTRKSKSARRDGFRGHVAAEPETGLVTDCEMTMAAGQGSTDAENGVKMARRDRFAADSADADGEGGADSGNSAGTGETPEDGAGSGGTAGAAESTGAGDGPQAGGLEIYGDSAYGTGDARAEYRDAGLGTVIKPGPLRPAVPGGFVIDDFTVDEDNGTVTCPAGVTRTMSARRNAVFGAACAGCPLRDRCTTAKDGRSMSIHPHEGLLRAARARARTEEFKKAYPTRSAIERVIAWTATRNGRRIRLRYLGTAKNDAWLHTRCAAVNLRTLLRHGLTRSEGTWVLA